jgi:hypothetical protein
VVAYWQGKEDANSKNDKKEKKKDIFTLISKPGEKSVYY